MSRTHHDIRARLNIAGDLTLKSVVLMVSQSLLAGWCQPTLLPSCHSNNDGKQPLHSTFHTDLSVISTCRPKKDSRTVTESPVVISPVPRQLPGPTIPQPAEYLHPLSSSSRRQLSTSSITRDQARFRPKMAPNYRVNPHSPRNHTC